MADETKKYIINIESNYEEYNKQLVEAKKNLEAAQRAQEALKGGQIKSREEQEKVNTQLRQAQKEYSNAKKNIDLVVQSNKAQKGSYEELYKTWQLAQTQLKLMGGAYTTNEKGVRVLSQRYIEQKQVVADAKKGLDAFGKGVNDNRLNVGNYQSALEGASQSLKGVGLSMLAAIGPVALVTGALNKLKEAFFETEAGAKVLKKWGESVKTYFQSLVSGANTLESGFNVAGALAVAEEMDKDRKGNRIDLIEIAKLEASINDLRLKSVAVSTTQTEKLALIKQAEEQEQKLIEYKIKDKEDELRLVNLMLIFRSEDTKLLDQQAQLEAEIITIRSSKSLRLATQENALNEKELADAEKRKEKIKKDEEERVAIELAANKKILQAREEMEAALQELDNMAFNIWEEADAEQQAKTDEKQRDKWEKEAQTFAMNEENKKNILLDSLTSDFEYKTSLLQMQYDEEIKAANKIGADTLLIEKKYAQYKIMLARETEESKLNIIADFAGALQGIFREQTMISKVAAIAQATISTYLSAQKAYEANAAIPPTPLWSVLAAGAAIVSGIATVNKIISVNPDSPTAPSAPTSITSSPVAQRTFAQPSNTNLLTAPQLSQNQLNALPTNTLTAKEIAIEIAKLPPPIVTVEAIDKVSSAKNKVEVRARI